ncbi:MAG: hypothetical protein HYY52_08520 [Candidatus Melainabacteria bacterium]|nr:hypothetical protein [Candidatus Melainabacteria bacterium]
MIDLKSMINGTENPNGQFGQSKEIQQSEQMVPESSSEISLPFRSNGPASTTDKQDMFVTTGYNENEAKESTEETDETDDQNLLDWLIDYFTPTEEEERARIEREEEAAASIEREEEEKRLEEAREEARLEEAREEAREEEERLEARREEEERLEEAREEEKRQQGIAAKVKTGKEAQIATKKGQAKTEKEQRLEVLKEETALHASKAETKRVEERRLIEQEEKEMLMAKEIGLEKRTNVATRMLGMFSRQISQARAMLGPVVAKILQVPSVNVASKINKPLVDVNLPHKVESIIHSVKSLIVDNKNGEELKGLLASIQSVALAYKEDVSRLSTDTSSQKESKPEDVKDGGFTAIA